MATIKDVRVIARLNVQSVLLKDKGEADERPGRHGSQRKTIIDCQEVEVPMGELETRLTHAQLVLEHGYRVNTAVIPPDVVTDDATNIDVLSATFNGHVNPNGQATVVRFEYAYTPKVDGWVVCDETPLAGVTNQTVHKDLALLAGSKVYYRVRAVSAAGTYYGIIKSFYTLPTP